MLRALDVETGLRVLEIGTGSGYSTALLAELVGSNGLVVTIDIDPPVTERAASLLSRRVTRTCTPRPGMVDVAGDPAPPYDRVVAWFL